MTNGVPHDIMMLRKASNQPNRTNKGDEMADSRAKTAWEKENVIQVKVKINRNQDPELYDLLQQAVSKSGLARDLMKQAISKSK